MFFFQIQDYLSSRSHNRRASVRLDDIVFQTYLATAEESETASEELSSQDEMLKGKADAFVRKEIYN
jgi:hypothetical protein